VVEVAAAQVEGAFSAGTGLEVEPDQQEVEVGVAAGGADGIDQLLDLAVVERATTTGPPSRLGDGGGRVGGDEPDSFRPAEQRPQRCHAVLPRRTAVAGGSGFVGASAGCGDDGGA